MSKLSFRARALDASKPMPIYLAEELPDLPDYSAINRAVPQMPSGMEKEEECEHHLQRAICTGLIIPTPEVSDMTDSAAFDRLYPSDYRMPRQLIHMQPLGLEQDVPDYDMDSEDEKWLKKQHAAAGSRKCDLTELKFEETMERLERSSGQTVVTLREARALAGRAGPAEHVLAAVYDYWLNKRLATQQPLLLAVRTEPRPGQPPASPYLAFRRRTEKMQTRKNRKNDESSYEKMVKLRRELFRAVSLLELVKKRERAKRDILRLAAALLEKRYSVRDFSGHLLAEAAASSNCRVPVAAPLATPVYSVPHHRPTVDPTTRQREKRQYKRRKHRHHSSAAQAHTLHHGVSGSSSSSEGEAAEAAPPPDPSGPYAFRRKPGCQYHMPTAGFGPSADVPWRTGGSKENTHPGDPDQRLRYSLTSLRHPWPRCIGLARRRMGRGGRVLLDRLSSPAALDRLWAALDYTLTDSHHPSRPLTPVPHPLKTEVGDDWTLDKSRSAAEINRVPLQENSEKVYLDGITVKEEMDPDCLPSDQEERLGFPGAAQKMEPVQIVPPSDRCSFSFWDDGSGVRNSRFNDSELIGPSDSDLKMMSELLVRRRLGRSDALTHHDLQEVFDDRLHFRPQSPPPSAPRPTVLPDENEASLTVGTPICVRVRLALPLNSPDPAVPPCDGLFGDSEPYHAAEFTLADLYGDSLLPDSLDRPVAPVSRTPHANGPDKLTDKENFLGDGDDSSSRDTSSFRTSSTENSHSGQGGAFLSSGGPSSATVLSSEGASFSGLDLAATTNGPGPIKSDFNGGDDSEENSRLLESERRRGSSAFRVKSPGSNRRIYVTPERPYDPPSPARAAPPPAQKAVTAAKQERRPGVATVRAFAPPQQGDGRPPLLLARHKTALTLERTASGLAGKAEVGRRIIAEDQTGTGRNVTVAVPEALKLRLPGHLLGGGGGAHRDRIDFVHKAVPATTIARDGAPGHSPQRTVVHLGGAVGHSKVKVVRTLSAAQRSRLLAANRVGEVAFSDLANILQAQRVYSTERLEGAAAPPEAAAPPAAPAAPGASAAAPAKQPRKGQASLPMEVT